MLESLFNAATGLWLTPAQVFSCELIEILRTSFLLSPVPVTLRRMPCDFIKTSLDHEDLKKIFRFCFGTDIQQNNFEALYFFSQFSSLYRFWRWHIFHDNCLMQADGRFLFWKHLWGWKENANLIKE